MGRLSGGFDEQTTFIQIGTGRRHHPHGEAVSHPRQRQTVLKWFLFSLVYLALQVLQDVVFSRVQVLGLSGLGAWVFAPGVPDPGAGVRGLFALLAGVFRCLSGAVLGPVSLLVVTCSGVLLSAFRGGYLQRRFWPVMLCAWAGVLLHQGLMFSLGLFLGSTAAGRWMEALGGRAGDMPGLLRPISLVLALGKIGGETWKE